MITMVKPLFPVSARHYLNVEQLEQLKIDHEDDYKKQNEDDINIKMFDDFDKAEHEKVKTLRFTPKAKSQGIPGKVLFASKAVKDTIDDLPQWVKNHPCIVDMTNKDICRAYILAQQLSITNTKALFAFGDEKRELFSTIVNKIVETAKASFLTQANNLIETSVKVMVDMNINTLLANNKSKWYQRIVGLDESYEASKIRDQCNTIIVTVNSNLDEASEISRDLITKLDVLDTLYQQNLESFTILQIEIAAGRMFIHMTTEFLETSQTAATVFAQSDRAYQKMCLDQFDAKIVDMESIAHSVITNAPQIRMMQLNIYALAERSKSIKTIFVKWRASLWSAITTYQEVHSIDQNELIDYSDTQKLLKNC